MRVALAGNPNSGKTTMYNCLTGKNEKVGNWAGVTVEKKEGLIKKTYYDGEEDLGVVDLPGAYSMSPFTSEESITRSYVKNERPDVIINIVDATNLSRSLFFTTQLLELGIPVVVALNKSDLNEKNHTVIQSERLSQKLGCPVVKTVSTSGSQAGLKQVVETVVSLRGCEQQAPYCQGEINLNQKSEVEQADRRRFEFVKELVAEVEKRKIPSKDKNRQDRIDEVFTHPISGLMIFAAVMFFVFHISQSEGTLGLGKWLEGLFTGWIEEFQQIAASWVQDANPFLQSVLIDGMIGGVGAVVGFLPLVMVMYFMIALLEDCGYLARATVVLDPIFKRVGLSGKSVIPMIIGTGCAIPGIMACRTIRDERERRATAMLTPFMPCGAKLPVIALFVGAFFSDVPWIGTMMYFVGILLILLGALLIRTICGCRHQKTYFIMELPEYKMPSLFGAVRSMLSRGKSYIIKAGTIILVCNTIVQIMQSFDWRLQLVEEGMESSSILAVVASPMAVLLIPIVGTAAWQLAAAAVTGFIAKENVVGTLAVCYGLSAFIDTEELTLIGDGNVVASAMAITKVAALSFLMFNLYTPPCFAALGAMNSEMQSKKWLWGGIGLQFGIGYTLAFLVYQIGTFVTTGEAGAGLVPGVIAILSMVAVVVWLIVLGKRANFAPKTV